MNLPRLPRQPIRPDLESDIDREVWKPEWKCFCCHDSGIVMSKLAELVIPDYDDKRDKPVACYLCNEGSLLHGNEAYDQRFTRGICSQLDFNERDDWTRTVIAQQQQFVERQKQLTEKISMRKRSRTPEEEIAAQRLHEETSNADPPQLHEMAEIYLGSDWLKDGVF